MEWSDPMSTTPRHASPRPAGMALLLVALLLSPARALTLADLLSDPALTPRRFANQFDSFDYEFATKVQKPDEFLRSRKGDCDDYAVLADFVLSQKSYTTRLIHVRMVGRVAHAVCYVMQDRIYLDYNNRIYALNLERSGPSLREVATKVARSIEANWTSATEFKYSYEAEQKLPLFTVVKTEPPSKDPDYNRY